MSLNFEDPPILEFYFSNKYILEYYTNHSWLNLWMWNKGYAMLIIKL